MTEVKLSYECRCRSMMFQGGSMRKRFQYAIGLVIGAYMGYLFGGLGSTPVSWQAIGYQDSSFFSKFMLALFAAIEIYIAPVMGYFFRKTGNPETLNKLYIFAFIWVGSLPAALAYYDLYFGPFLFDAACSNPTQRDFALYVIDNFAKGAVLDFFKVST